MVGPKLYIKTKDIGVTLAPYKKEYMELLVEKSSSAKVRMYSGGPFGTTIETETESYERMRKLKTSIMWAIIPDDQVDPIGYTAIHNISYDGGCSSEIMIFDSEWWGKGVASQAHIIRTWYAADHLNRSKIHANIAEKNIASIKAAEKIGYFKTGKVLRSYYRNGQYSDGIIMVWINPFRIEALYPEGIPQEYRMYIEKGKRVLEFARENVKLL